MPRPTRAASAAGLFRLWFGYHHVIFDSRQWQDYETDMTSHQPIFFANLLILGSIWARTEG